MVFSLCIGCKEIIQSILVLLLVYFKYNLYYSESHDKSLEIYCRQRRYNEVIVPGTQGNQQSYVSWRVACSPPQCSDSKLTLQSAHVFFGKNVSIHIMVVMKNM